MKKHFGSFTLYYNRVNAFVIIACEGRLSKLFVFCESAPQGLSGFIESLKLRSCQGIKRWLLMNLKNYSRLQ